jgi:hypothetical protein
MKAVSSSETSDSATFPRDSCLLCVDQKQPSDEKPRLSRLIKKMELKYGKV